METFSINDLFSVVKKHRLLILGSIIAGVIIAAFITFAVMTPKYSAHAELLVNRKNSSSQNAQYDQFQTDVQMINTYKDIIKNPIILKPVQSIVKKNSGFTGSIANLQDDINVSSKQNSQVFSIDVSTNNPYISADIANVTAQTFKKNVGKIMSVNNVSVISNAKPNFKQTSPRIALNFLIGFILGCLLGIGLAIISEMLDTTVKEEDFIVNDIGFTNLGILDDILDADLRQGKLKSRNRPKMTREEDER